MRNMVILIDTNVLLNYLTSREDQYLDQSIRVIKMCAEGRCVGYIAFHSLSILWYVLRKWDDRERRCSLRNLCEILTIANATQDEILKAIDNDSFKDFEDCLQDKCACNVEADYIITSNVKDFSKSEIPAVTPEQFLKLIRQM